MNPPNTFSDRNYLTTGLLAIFAGVFGGHRFYLGKTGTGLVQLFTLGGFGVWALLDIVQILIGTVEDSKGLVVAKTSSSAKILYGVSAIYLLALVVTVTDPAGVSSGKPDDESTASSSSNEWKPTKSNIVGFYHSEKGMGGWGGTIELLYGNSYFLKDQMLENGEMIGEYSLSDNEITFYKDGAVVFRAVAEKGYINIGPGRAYYCKK